MAVSYTPTTITTGYNLTKLNDNFTAITTALADAVSRSGNGANTLTADLDANSKKIINLADPINGGDAISKSYGDANFGTTNAAAVAAAVAAAISETNAGVSETNAASSASASATSASDAAAEVVLLNAGLSTTSSTSAALATTSSLAITVETGKLYVPGHPIVMSRTSDPSNFNQVGTVVTYNSGTGAMVLDIDGAVEGTGTFSAWTITVGGVQGPQGATGSQGTAGAAGQITEKVYIAGTDYDKNVDDELTLLATVTSEEYIDIHMDTAFQDRDTYGVSGTLVTFDAPIPSDKVTIVSHTSFGIGTPSDNTVTSAKIVNNTIVAADIAANTITASEIAANAVDTSELASSAVTTVKIASNAVDGSKIAMGSDAQGDILFYGGTDYGRLGAGTSGQFLKTNGAGSNPEWGTLPASTLPTANFISTGQTVTVDTALSVTHSLGGFPTLWQVILRCTDAGGDAGYAQNDEVMWGDSGSGRLGTNDGGCQVMADATTIKIIQGLNVALIGKSSFNLIAITTSKWEWEVRAWS